MRATLILLVEDDPEDIEIFTMAVLRMVNSVNVKALQDGEDVLRQLGERSLAPQIMFVNMYMMRMNGLDLLQKLRAMEHIVPIPAILYGESNPPLTVSKLNEGKLYQEFLIKPNNIGDFTTALDMLVGKYVH